MSLSFIKIRRLERSFAVTYDLCVSSFAVKLTPIAVRTPTQAQNTSNLYLVGFEEAASFLDSAGLDVLEGVAGADEPVGKDSSILTPRS